MLSISSPAFADGEPIPREHTCDGADRSPPLSFAGLPQGTKGLALIVDDPDAPGGTFVHWVLYNVPPTVTELPPAIETKSELTKPIVAHQGQNDFRRAGYGGPCPPKGAPHRYMFKLYALDAEVALPPGATKSKLLDAMQGHVLGEAMTTGTYAR